VGDQWQAHCPAHEDGNPSLSITTGNHGRVLVKCFAGCSYDEIVSASGLEPADLFRQAAWNGGGHKREAGEPESVYRYVDEQGELLFEVCRYPGKKFRQRRPDPSAAGGYSWRLKGVRRVLYRLPQVLAAVEAGETVYLVEGEKDVEALERAGVTATCNPGGAGKWRSEYSEVLNGAAVVIVADGDEPGRRHAAEVAAVLEGVASSIKIVEPAAGKDASDHLAAGLPLAAFLAPQTDTALLVQDVCAFIRRFVVLSEAQAIAVGLWILHTYVFRALGITPYLSITSAEKQSGKTVLLEVLSVLVREPWFTGSTSPAVLARKVNQVEPTLLLDESDAAFKGDRDYAEALRGILNTGFKASGIYSRCEGNGANLTFRDFRTFSPKAIAGIGRLPGTLEDRSIPIRLKRKAPGERVERKRERTITAEASLLRQRLQAWAAAHEQQLRELDYDQFESLLEALPARAADIWEPLFGIALLAGEDAVTQATTAALVLSGGCDADEGSLGERLLADIRDVYCEQAADRLTSSQLVARLNELEDAPWAEFNAGRPLTTNRLAALLRRYEIRPRTIRLRDGQTPKGYLLDQFQDAFARYLPPPAAPAATPPHPACEQQSDRGGSDLMAGAVAVSEPPDPAPHAECGGVAAATAREQSSKQPGPTPEPLETWEQFVADGRAGARERGFDAGD
jgi:5S rRNA maturation endonuclease (ribonuclease M5)